MKQFRRSEFHKLGWWRGTGQVQTIYTAYNFDHFAIYLPKIIKLRGNLTKLWQKQKCTVFLICQSCQHDQFFLEHTMLLCLCLQYPTSLVLLDCFSDLSSSVLVERYVVGLRSTNCEITFRLSVCLSVCDARDLFLPKRRILPPPGG